MKYLLITLLFISCGKQTHTVEVEVPKEMPTIEVDAPEEINVVVEDSHHTFGPDFEAWLSYCQGQVEHEVDKGTYTQNEFDYQVKECYYNIEFELPTQGETPTEEDIQQFLDGNLI